MTHRRRFIPSRPCIAAIATDGARGIQELDRFSDESLERWNEISQDLDQLNATLYFSLEPERRRHRAELVEALQSIPHTAMSFSRWCRMITYRYSLAPLSCAGSLQYIGGRFNAGTELEVGTLTAWPALYIAQDFETAYREKYQLASSHAEHGLAPHEMALESRVSTSTLLVDGRLIRVFDLTEESLAPVAAVLSRITLPAQAVKLKKKLGIQRSGLTMVRSAQSAYNTVLKANWRLGPVQFGLPSSSQILAELIRTAGFEAIRYQSTKGPSHCLAVFPDKLVDDSFVQLSDAAPSIVQHCRLDCSTAAALAGWDSVAQQLRPR